ncbi:MAG TPA: DNA topoisomerase IB, partial [Actinomycetota bacterium]|nr:DNA topoisomerase IB [Actinomycetota bacterium]
KGFRYRGPDGEPVKDPGALARIRTLAVPPAWTDVWICPSSNGHIQATGRDARGRKQYRYHERWREVRDATKYDRLIAFAKALPKIRRRVERDLARAGLPREKVLATIVRLLDRSLIRVGNPEYARDNESYGLTTFRDKHVQVNGEEVRFSFRGKSGKEHDVAVSDRRVAAIVRRCRDIPGQELFQYIDDAGDRRSIGSADVNSYLREIAGEDFTAKHFRTWGGTVSAMTHLLALGEAATPRQADKRVVAAIKEVAAELGNTPAVSRACYVHPHVIQGYQEGALTSFEPREARPKGLRADEARTLAFLEHWARRLRATSRSRAKAA